MSVDDLVQRWFWDFKAKYGVLPTKLWMDPGMYQKLHALAYKGWIELSAHGGNFPGVFEQKTMLTIGGIPVYQR